MGRLGVYELLNGLEEAASRFLPSRELELLAYIYSVLNSASTGSTAILHLLEPNQYGI